jgi:hypothetical protein
MENLGSEAILVLGMHRSGTSAVAGALSLLGATPPARMLPAASDNPSGFWESASVLGVNDWILHKGNGAWYECLGFDPNAFDARTRARALTYIILCVMAEFGGAKLKLIKDPRLCLLLDLWLPALSAVGTSPVVVLVLRPPDEVAGSLDAREHMPLGISVALWLRYMLDAEFATRACRRHVVAYADLLRDWRRALTLTGHHTAITWPVDLEAAAPRMDRFIDSRLHHFGPVARPTSTTTMPLAAWLEETYAALQGLEQDGTDRRQLERLDCVRAAFQTWCRSQGGIWTETFLRGHAIRASRRFEVPPDWHRIASEMPNGITLPAD